MKRILQSSSMTSWRDACSHSRNVIFTLALTLLLLLVKDFELVELEESGLESVLGNQLSRLWSGVSSIKVPASIRASLYIRSIHASQSLESSCSRPV